MVERAAHEVGGGRRRDERVEPAVRDLVVPVAVGDEVAARGSARVPRVGGAAGVGGVDDAQSGDAIRVRRDDLEGAVRRPVVADQHLPPAVVRLGREGLELGAERRRRVVGGDHDGRERGTRWPAGEDAPVHRPAGRAAALLGHRHFASRRRARSRKARRNRSVTAASAKATLIRIRGSPS